ncbi:MAG: hypothetical protein A2Y38_25260 [Spirochaetes bacterium GWB1_59_5]|nr:MAG: hypothetical protein A2Y38_25260 [Spirochaetes bacterium GWB1_59_5]
MKKPNNEIDAAAFRKELVKIMPGYEWVVHKTPRCSVGRYVSATGIITSGFNRVSTLSVLKRKFGKLDVIEYEVKSSGYGKRSPWLSTATRSTLAQALRTLQDHYDHMAVTYGRHARDLRDARKEAQ